VVTECETPTEVAKQPEWWGLDPAAKARWYIDGVRSGAIVVNEYQRLAVERHLNDLRDGESRGLWFDERAAILRIRFIEAFCRHSKGVWAGKLVVLSPWQAFIKWCVYGWKRRRDNLRRFRVAYEEVARKNGKSTDAAGAALVGLVADGEQGAEVYVAATKRDQAKIVHGEAVRMVKRSPELRAVVQTLRDNLSVAATNSKCEPLGADADTMDGTSPSTAIIDEIHAHPNREVYDKLDTGTGARQQPLIWIITTAGADMASAWGEFRDYAEKVLRGILPDDTFFAFIACADEKDDPWDPVTWWKANPNLGISVQYDDLERKANKAKNVPSQRNAFLRYHLNVPTSMESALIPTGAWDACTDPLDVELLAGQACYGGLDLSRTSDTTSYVLAFPPTPERPKWAVLRWSWLPGEQRNTQLPAVISWIDQGLIVATPTLITDYDAVERVMLDTKERYDIREVCFDQWNATEFAEKKMFGEHGMPMVKFPQNIASYNEPSKRLIELVTEGKLIHGGDPVLRWMAANAVGKEDVNGNLRPIKASKNSKKRIDAIAALIMAIGRATLTEPTDSFDFVIIDPRKRGASH
jgi:phage terminase large subunit-like protein